MLVSLLMSLVLLMFVGLALIGLAFVVVINRSGIGARRVAMVMGMATVMVPAIAVIVGVMMNRYASRQKECGYPEGWK